jgi:hypothetical protein
MAINRTFWGPTLGVVDTGECTDLGLMRTFLDMQVAARLFMVLE